MRISNSKRRCGVCYDFDLRASDSLCWALLHAPACWHDPGCTWLTFHPFELGTTWAYLTRHIIGVSEGHNAILRLVGVGYRATVEERPSKATFTGQKFLCLKLGFTHPIEEPIPAGVTASTPAPTRILLEGISREEVMSFAGKVRKWRPPEPYKGKGVFINDQTIKLKQKKIK
jgi:large subunit ribosomal protein L6